MGPGVFQSILRPPYRPRQHSGCRHGILPRWSWSRHQPACPACRARRSAPALTPPCQRRPVRASIWPCAPTMPGCACFCRKATTRRSWPALPRPITIGGYAVAHWNACRPCSPPRALPRARQSTSPAPTSAIASTCCCACSTRGGQIPLPARAISPPPWSSPADASRGRLPGRRAPSVVRSIACCAPPKPWSPAAIGNCCTPPPARSDGPPAPPAGLTIAIHRHSPKARLDHHACRLPASGRQAPTASAETTPSPTAYERAGH